LVFFLQIAGSAGTCFDLKLPFDPQNKHGISVLAMAEREKKKSFMR